MAERDNHMEHLVDAFRGLAEGDGQSNYLADVEAIVNSYFKNGNSGGGGGGGGGARPATPTRAVPTRQPPSPPQQQRGLYDEEADAARPDAYDVLGESPIKPALFSGRGVNAATAATAAAQAHAMDASHSSGGSLQAWGTAAEDIHHVAVATRRIGEQRSGVQQQQQQRVPRQQRQQQQQQQAPPARVADDESAQLAETQPQHRVRQGDDLLHGRDVDLQLLPEYDDDFYTRSVEWQRRQTEQRSKQKSAVKDKETEGCTWRPAINKYTYTNSGRLVYGKVEDRLVASESARQQRLEDERRRREERETEGCTFKPRVNTASGLGSQINSRYMDTAHSISHVSARSAGGGAGADAAAGGGGPQQETFERLYRQGRKSRGQQDEPPPGTPTPVLYTTFNPSRPPPGGHAASRLNMSVEEIEATERELSDIEALLTQRMLQTGRIAVVESNYEDSDGDAADGAHDVAGYTEDSDASASRGTADFSTFLMRQNAFEERRRANLAYIEAETAAPLHPTITQRSLKMKTDKTKDKTGRPPADVQRQRLQKLAAESIELHVEVERVHAECGALLRKINLVRKLPGAGRVSAAVSSLQAELRTLRLTDKETGEYHASLKPRKKELKVCPDDDVLSRVLLDRDRGKTLRPGEQLQAWLREMVEVRNGLAELRTLSTRVRDALTREKDEAVKANEGKIPWEVMAEMECPRSRGGGSGGGGGLGGASRVEQGEKAKPGGMLAVVGDRVRARREDWQAWQQGDLVSIEGGKAMVTVEGCKKPQPFPANIACVVVAPSEETDAPLHPTLRVKENALKHCIRTKEPVSVRLGIIGQSLRGRVITGEGKTWTVAVLDPESHSSRLVRKTVSIDAIKLDHEIGSENYAPEFVAARHGGNSLYISNLKTAQREAAQRQSEAVQEKSSKEEAECTHRPHINTAPRYVKRMAQSMQLLRGEDD